MALLIHHFRWDGKVMSPVGYTQRVAEKAFEPARIYALSEEEDGASDISRRHFFACVSEAWAQLPEHLAATFPTDDVLRYHALIRTGFHVVSSQTVCKTRGEVERMVRALNGITHEYSVINVDGLIVTRLVARSMRERGGMRKKEFGAAKDAVLAFLDDLLGTERGALERNAERAA